MSVSFATSYIDRLFLEKNALGLYQVIEALFSERSLSEEFWTFCRLLEWSGSARSGSWQYYECLPNETFERVVSGMERMRLTEAAEMYRLGRVAAANSKEAARLDQWLYLNEQKLIDHAQEMLSMLKSELYSEH